MQFLVRFLVYYSNVRVCAANVLVLVAAQAAGGQSVDSEEDMMRLLHYVPELTCVQQSSRLFPISKTDHQQADSAFNRSMQLWLKGNQSFHCLEVTSDKLLAVLALAGI